MAFTALADVYVPEIANPAIFDEAIATSKVISSDAVSVDATMSQNMTGNGLVFTSPSFINLADAALPALIPNDDPTDLGEPKAISSYESFYHRLARNNGWASMDVVADITGNDPMRQIAAQYGAAVAKVREESLMKTLAGIMNTTVAGTTLYKVIGAEATGSVTASTKFNPEALIDLFYSVYSDNFDGADGYTMFVHPLVAGFMAKEDLFDGEKISEGGLTVKTYMGVKVVPTRVAPSRAGTTSGTLYTTYLVRDGNIAMGVGAAKRPTELQREPQIGNSGGGDIFWVRDVFGFAVNGFSFTGTPSATLADSALANAANWTRVLEPEQIGIAALVSNI